MKPLELLLLCNLPIRHANASTIAHHIKAFEQYSRHNIYCLSHIGALPARLRLDRFDGIVIHYSIVLPDEYYLTSDAKRKIGEFQGLKIRFHQDEYRQVNAVIGDLRRMGMDVLFTCVPDDEIEKVYPENALLGVSKLNNLTGFVPEHLLALRVPPIAQRPLDVSYRAREAPFWLGKLGAEKYRIVPGFVEATRGAGLTVDVSCREEDRVYGEHWIELLVSSKAVLGVESGASVFDFTGDIQRNVEGHVREHPHATFEEVHDRFFAAEDGRIRLNQISPRCFEAAALRTAMVLFEGEYSGVLQPWRHFIPLRKDFGNIDEVVAALRDHARLQEMVDRTYREVALNPRYSYRAFVERVDAVLEQEFVARGKHRAVEPYTRLAYWNDLALSPGYLSRRMLSVALQQLLRESLKPWRVFWRMLPTRVRDMLRPFFSK